jgi:hypothetical protein
MAAQLGGIAEIEGWTQPVQRPLPQRISSGILTFARRKPLGFVCGVIVLFFMVVGDLIPETINKITSTAGLGSHVPYLADSSAPTPSAATSLVVSSTALA